MQEAAKLLELDFTPTEWDVHLDMCGPGYAIPSPEGNAAIRMMAANEGLFLDPVYTGKAFAGLVKTGPRGTVQAHRQRVVPLFRRRWRPVRHRRGPGLKHDSACATGIINPPPPPPGGGSKKAPACWLCPFPCCTAPAGAPGWTRARGASRPPSTALPWVREVVLVWFGGHDTTPGPAGRFSASINPLYVVRGSFTQGRLEGAKPASNKIKCRAKPCLARRAWSEATIFVPQGGTKIMTLFQAVEKSRRLFSTASAWPLPGLSFPSNMVK